MQRSIWTETSQNSPVQVGSFSPSKYFEEKYFWEKANAWRPAGSPRSRTAYDDRSTPEKRLRI